MSTEQNMTAEQYLAKAEGSSEYTGNPEHTQALALIAIAKFLQRLSPSSTEILLSGPDA